MTVPIQYYSLTVPIQYYSLFNVKMTNSLVKIDIFVTKLNDRDFKTMQNI